MEFSRIELISENVGPKDQERVGEKGISERSVQIYIIAQDGGGGR